ncbi:MAG TPA: OadG family protein [Halanaerobiales bacterium]|nr:OadG family protein [Halanaerobiales bacterium]
MNPLELLRDPTLVQSMTLSEKLLSGLQVAILGMAIVFFILFLLMLVLNILKRIFYSEKMDFKEDTTQVQPKVPDVETKVNRREEKVAAIMAAIMSMEDMTQKGKFRIRKITRVKDDVPIWGRIARGGGISENNKGELL